MLVNFKKMSYGIVLLDVRFSKQSDNPTQNELTSPLKSSSKLLESSDFI